MIALMGLSLSCKKEKFDLGYYKMTMIWSETVLGEKKEFQKKRGLSIISETKTYIEIAYAINDSINATSSVKLLKKGKHISGMLPFDIDSTSIDGKKHLFNNSIEGSFNTVYETSQGMSGAPSSYHKYNGKFKMEKK